jgi:hypothetical protein
MPHRPDDADAVTVTSDGEWLAVFNGVHDVFRLFAELPLIDFGLAGHEPSVPQGVTLCHA